LESSRSKESSTILEKNSMAKNYVIKDGEIARTKPFCPRCGDGVFMARATYCWMFLVFWGKRIKSYLIFYNGKALIKHEM